MPREVRVIIDVSDVQALIIACPNPDCGRENRVPLRSLGGGLPHVPVPLVPLSCHYCNSGWGRQDLGRDYVDEFRKHLVDLAAPPAGTLYPKLELRGEFD